MSDEYTPTKEEVRERFVDGFPMDTWAVSRAACGEEFDRWLADHDERVRIEERERCAQQARRVQAAIREADAAIRAVSAEQERACTCGWGGAHDPDNPRCDLFERSAE